VIIVPDQLADACRGVPKRMAWLEQLPEIVRDLQSRWRLSLGEPWTTESSCSWVAPAVDDGGIAVVLKVAMPHMEAAHEIEGLRFWDGEPTVRLLDADTDLQAMLLERCEPGTALRELPEEDADVVIAALLCAMWRRPPDGHPFRPLSTMLAAWAEETRAAHERWTDPGLVRAGLGLFEQLSAAAPDDVLLPTDLHAANVLRARRRPWLAIDPKPFVGDRAYDATQHLFNCQARMTAAPHATIRRFAGLLGVDHERVRLWMFARSAAEPREHWTGDSMALARALA
jgi:streptomycin 6-kinase